jgi:hypothetical protein
MPWLAPPQQQQQQQQQQTPPLAQEQQQPQRQQPAVGGVKAPAAAAAGNSSGKSQSRIPTGPLAQPNIQPLAGQQQQHAAKAAAKIEGAIDGNTVPADRSRLTSDDDGLSIHPGVMQLPFHEQQHSQPGSANCSYNGAGAAAAAGNGSSSSKWFNWDWVQRRSSSGSGAAPAAEQQQQQQQQQQERAGTTGHAPRSMRASLEDRLMLAAVSVSGHQAAARSVQREQWSVRHTHLGGMRINATPWCCCWQ